MNLLAKSILAGTLLLTLAGCKTEFDGTTTVTQKMTVKLKKGYGNLNVGTYASTIKFSSKKKATLEIKVSGNNNNIELPISVPKNSLPQDNGPISWKAEEIEQTFDVDGNLKTTVSESGSRRGTESCQETIPYRECYVDSQGRRICRDGYRTVTGVRDIEYFDRSYDRNVNLDLKDPKSGAVTAVLSGRNTDIERVVIYHGYCRAYGSLYDGYGQYLHVGAQYLLGH